MSDIIFFWQIGEDVIESSYHIHTPQMGVFSNGLLFCPTDNSGVNLFQYVSEVGEPHISILISTDWALCDFAS